MRKSFLAVLVVLIFMACESQLPETRLRVVSGMPTDLSHYGRSYGSAAQPTEGLIAAFRAQMAERVGCLEAVETEPGGWFVVIYRNDIADFQYGTRQEKRHSWRYYGQTASFDPPLALYCAAEIADAEDADGR